MHSLKSNFIWNSAYQVVRIVIPLVTIPYLSRVLGSDALGTYSYTYTVALYFTYFCLLGLGQYGNREIAKARNDKHLRSRVFCSIFTMQVVIGIFVMLIYLIYTFTISGNLFIYTQVWCLWVFAEIFDISWFFYGMEDFRKMTIRNIIVRVGVVVCIFIFVHKPSDLVVYCALQSFSYVVNSLILWCLLKGQITFVIPKLREVLAHIKPNLTLFAPVLAISMYTHFNEIILGNLSGMDNVAFYDNAYKIVVIPLAFIQSLATVMLPRMSTVVKNSDKVAADYYLGISSWFSHIMAFGLMFGIMGVSQQFVPVFFGRGFELCESLMPILSLIIPICAWSSLLGNQYLIPTERDVYYLVSVLGGAILDISLCCFLVVPLGAVGATVATVCAEFFVAIIQTFMVSGYLPRRRFLLDALPFIAIGLVEFFLVKFLGQLSGATVIGVACQILAGGVSYIALSFIWLKCSGDKRLEILTRKNAKKEN